MNHITEDITKNLTQAQRNALIEFKEVLRDILTPHYTDTSLIKWLRARNYDVKAAEHIFRINYNNRIVFGINTIVDTYEKPEVTRKYEGIGVIGFAKDGSLVRYIAAGHSDAYGIILSMSIYDLCLYFSHMMECDIQQLERENLKTGRKVEEITYVIDLEGFHLQQIFHKSVLETAFDFTRLLQDCYPEVWRNILIINAPVIFDKAFHIFKPALRMHILAKIKVADKDSTKKLLLEFIDEDVLPVFLGGEKVDSYGDPMCKEYLRFGGKIPEKFYSLNHSLASTLSPNEPGVKCYTIQRRSMFNCPIAVDKGDTIMEFDTRSENGSLALSLLYRKFEEGENSTNPDFPDVNSNLDDEDSRYEMVAVSLRGQIHCTPMYMKALLQRPGIYVLRFSNAGNWLTTRKVYYRCILHPPKSSTV